MYRRGKYLWQPGLPMPLEPGWQPPGDWPRVRGRECISDSDRRQRASFVVNSSSRSVPSVSWVIRRSIAHLLMSKFCLSLLLCALYSRFFIVGKLVLLTVKCSSSVWGHSVHSQFSASLYMLYLGNG